MSFENNSFDTNSFSVASWLFILTALWKSVITATLKLNRVITDTLQR